MRFSREVLIVLLICLSRLTEFVTVVSKYSKPKRFQISQKLRISRARGYEAGRIGGQCHNTSLEVSAHNPAIPPVVNPTWQTPIPKFNCAILRKQGEVETPICSGALISKGFVLTVGSGCVLVDKRLYSPDDLLAVFVSYNKKQSEILNYECRVKKIILHEGCCRRGSYVPHNDLALLQLLDRVYYDEYLMPAKITRKKSLYHPGVLSHWDLSNFRAFHMAVDFRDAIWFVRSNFVSANICDSVISNKLFYKIMMTCASYYHVGTESCTADVGSPISYRGELVGLLLYKQYCGAPHSAALFVNIGVNSRWIRNKVGELTNNDENV